MGLVVVKWKILGVAGGGFPVRWDIGLAWVEMMNERYGMGTHWLEPACKSDAFVVQ